jgi:hypothetical protein
MMEVRAVPTPPGARIPGVPSMAGSCMSPQQLEILLGRGVVASIRLNGAWRLRGRQGIDPTSIAMGKVEPGSQGLGKLPSPVVDTASWGTSQRSVRL